MTFSTVDEHYMQLALNEARLSFDEGSYPIGAALVIESELFATGRNRMFVDGKWSSHAEHNLLDTHSKALRERLRGKQGVSVQLYTTLEPCLMCLGTALSHRVSEIIVACPDPSGGTAGLDVSSLGSFYQDRFPSFRIGLMREASYDLMVRFFKQEKLIFWEAALAEFEAMKRSWQA